MECSLSHGTDFSGLINMAQNKEVWGSRLGVVMSVAGSAVGLGNFLHFPGLAAQSNGRAFMIAYAISFLIIGLPIGWAEWAMGRYAGIIGFIIPVVIYTYYVILEPWCIGYAANF